jgi:hypothetical protein
MGKMVSGATVDVCSAHFVISVCAVSLNEALLLAQSVCVEGVHFCLVPTMAG